MPYNTRSKDNSSLSDITPTKKQKPNKINDSNRYLYLENTDLEGVEKIDEKPADLFFPNDVDGRSLYAIKDSMKKNAMVNIFKTRKDQPTASLKLKQVSVKIHKLRESHLQQKPCDRKSSNVNQNESKNDTSSEEYFDEGETTKTQYKQCSFNCNKKENEREDLMIQGIEGINFTEKSIEIRETRSMTASRLQAEQYIASQSQKTITSDNTLSKLKNKHLDEDQLQKLLSKNSHISNEHNKRINLLTKRLQHQFTEWIHIMEEGFTLLLYGLGSKRLLINDFYKTQLADEPTLIINGFFPSLSIKEILDNIIVDLLGLETVTNTSECFDIIERTMKNCPNDRIYLLIHNIDGGILRCNKAQDLLSRLASIPNLHLLASVDHINAPLIWDNIKRSRYNFFWMNATTYLPYEAETSYENSLLVQKSGALALLSLQNVFASLPVNAKNIYTILVKYQLEKKNHNYIGMAFPDLYRASREEFLVSSDIALRSQLIEFLDHKLVKMKRNVDGIECLVIPLDDALLKQFLENQNK